MTPRRRPLPPVPGSGVLDWRDSSHWSWVEKPCRYCGKRTQMRDSNRSPAHKLCAEEALRVQAAEATEAYRLDDG
jgi:hypothetical protein